MNRRQLIAGAAAVALNPTLGDAQPKRTRKVGFLTTISADRFIAEMGATKKALHELGWEVGTNIHYVLRSSEGISPRLPECARELVSLPVDVIVAHTTPSIRAAKLATLQIPIV